MFSFGICEEKYRSILLKDAKGICHYSYYGIINPVKLPPTKNNTGSFVVLVLARYMQKHTTRNLVITK